MNLQTREEGGCRVIAIAGSADVEASAALRESLLGAIEGGSKCIICDLGHTDFICSDALGVLSTTRLDHLFDVFPDVKGAIGGCKGKPR
jgi:anti-anti-sigma regulatory factor